VAAGAVVGLGTRAADAAAALGSCTRGITAAVLDPTVHIAPGGLSVPIWTPAPGRVLSTSAREAAIFDWLDAYIGRSRPLT
jgi:hypothetical protein